MQIIRISKPATPESVLWLSRSAVRKVFASGDHESLLSSLTQQFSLNRKHSLYLKGSNVLCPYETNYNPIPLISLQFKKKTTAYVSPKKPCEQHWSIVANQLLSDTVLNATFSASRQLSSNVSIQTARKNNSQTIVRALMLRKRQKEENFTFFFGGQFADCQLFSISLVKDTERSFELITRTGHVIFCVCQLEDKGGRYGCINHLKNSFQSSSFRQIKRFIPVKSKGV